MPNHLTPDRLEAYIEQTLDGGERAVVESHLATCAHCEGELSDLRALFEALESLPELAPSAGFTDRVMQGVRVRRPLLERVNEWLDEWLGRVAPSTNRGWAIATTVAAMPVLVVAATVWWVLSQPAVSAQEIWVFASGRTAMTLAMGWEWTLTSFAGSGLAAWLTGIAQLAGSLGRAELGLAAAVFATMMVVSVYVLYDNLFRSNARRIEHASYSF